MDLVQFRINKRVLRWGLRRTAFLKQNLSQYGEIILPSLHTNVNYTFIAHKCEFYL